MSLHDRDYARVGSERRRFTLPFPLTAVNLLLGVNVLVFLVWILAGGRASAAMGEHFSLSWRGLTERLYLHTLVTHAFSHFELFHLLFNLLALWVFGRVVEEHTGRGPFLRLYLAGALSGALLFLLVDRLPIPGHQAGAVLLGASGAVLAVVIACACLAPNLVVHIWGVLPIQMKWLALTIVLLDVLGLPSQEQSRVAHSAHLGGAAAGFVWFHWRRRAANRAGPGLLRRALGFFRRRPKLRIVEARAPEAPRASRPPEEDSRVDAATADRVDALLAKIHRGGLDSLTDEERDFLARASQKYKRK